MSYLKINLYLVPDVSGFKGRHEYYGDIDGTDINTTGPSPAAVLEELRALVDSRSWRDFVEEVE